jgi:putative MATE family efflux protein
MSECAVSEKELTDEDRLEVRNFLGALLKLSLPIAFQSLISAAVSSADVFMLARVGQDALSAVSLASQTTFVLTLFYFGLTTGASILAAQYWGKNDVGTIEKILGLALRISVMISFAFFLASLLIPRALMRLFSPDEILIAYGAGYLRAISFSYLFTGLSQMYLAIFKSMERTRVSAAISSVCLTLDIILNAVVVFLLFPGDPRMAAIGVALTTVVSRSVELMLCLVWNRRQKLVKLRMRHVLHAEGWLLKDFGRCTLPVQVNYLVWGGALTVTSALMGHIGSDMVSANSVAGAVRNLATVLCSGLAGGGGILLGKHLGARRLALAKQEGKRLLKWSLILGAFAGAAVLLVRPLCLSLVSMSPDTHRLLDGMLFICAYYCIGKSFNSNLVAGIFCAGGDTRFGLICDAVTMWGVILPLGYLCAFVWKWPTIWVFFVLCLDEFIKMPFVAMHYRKYRWINNLTHT